jgi:hypothetical protein
VILKLIAVVTMVAGMAGQQVPVFRTSRRVVSVHASVKQGNQPVVGLTPADFRLWDSGVAQEVTEVTYEEVPIDVTLFVDNSGSTFSEHGQFEKDIRGIAALLRPLDRLRVVAFALDVRVILDWTGPGAPIAVPPLSRAFSPVYDGVFLSMLHRPDPGRRHLIVAMTDGLDTGGVVRPDTIDALANRTDGVMHVLRVVSGGGAGPSRGALSAGAINEDQDGPARLKRAAEFTGGVAHEPLFRLNAVEYFKKAFDDFRTSYILRYTPVGVPLNGLRPIKVEVPGRGRLEIRHRQGYFGGPGTLDPGLR